MLQRAFVSGMISLSSLTPRWSHYRQGCGSSEAEAACGLPSLRSPVGLACADLRFRTSTQLGGVTWLLTWNNTDLKWLLKNISLNRRGPAPACSHAVFVTQCINDHATCSYCSHDAWWRAMGEWCCCKLLELSVLFHFPRHWKCACVHSTT